jgi:hypothetical protein
VSIDSVLAAGRAAAERLMTDSCRITRTSREAAGEFDPDTGRHEQPDPDDVYEGRCRVQVTDSLNAQTPDFGGRVVTVQKAVVQLPIGAADVQVGDVVEIKAAGSDPALVGRRYTVAASHAKTHATARRVQVEEVTG